MPVSRRAKTSFTSGELTPELLGRGDLRAYENGARRLRNVFIQSTGGVVRRPGLRHVAGLPGPARLAAFEFNTEQTYLLAFLHGRLLVFSGDAKVAETTGPWTEATLPSLAWTQSADTLLLFHPEMAPQRITRTASSGWIVQPFQFGREPFHRFAGPSVKLASSALTGVTT